MLTDNFLSPIRAGDYPHEPKITLNVVKLHHKKSAELELWAQPITDQKQVIEQGFCILFDPPFSELKSSVN